MHRGERIMRARGRAGVRRGARWLWGVLLGALAAGNSAGAEPVAPAAPLTVMTFNLRYAGPRPPISWAERRPVTKALLETLQPDIIGTQEGLWQQVKEIASDLPHHAWIGLGREGGSRGEFMAVYYRRERLEPLAFDHFWLSDTPSLIGSTSWGNETVRMVTWVKFRDLQTGRLLYCFNTHFDHREQGSREKSAGLVAERIAGLEPDLPVILMGDFNSAAGSGSVYERLVGPDGLTDTWTTAARRGPAIGTFHNYAGPREGASRIDWILTRGPLACQATEVVTFSANGQYPSDHFPVVATLAWEPAAPAPATP